MNQHGVAGTNQSNQSNTTEPNPQAQNTEEAQPLANGTGPVDQSNPNVAANNVTINPQQPNPLPATLATVPQLAGTPLIISLRGHPQFMSEDHQG